VTTGCSIPRGREWRKPDCGWPMGAARLSPALGGLLTGDSSPGFPLSGAVPRGPIPDKGTTPATRRPHTSARPSRVVLWRPPGGRGRWRKGKAAIRVSHRFYLGHLCRNFGALRAAELRPTLLAEAAFAKTDQPTGDPHRDAGRVRACRWPETSAGGKNWAEGFGGVCSSLDDEAKRRRAFIRAFFCGWGFTRSTERRGAVEERPGGASSVLISVWR